MPAFEAKPGMPYWQDLVTTQPQKAAYFYGKLLGWEVSNDAYRVARKEGLPVAGIVGAETDLLGWTPYFLGLGTDGVETLGGEVISTADVALGQMTICQDRTGCPFGLIEPHGEDQFVAAGEPGVPVWHEYIAPNQEAIDFYAELFDWEVVRDGNYFIAMEDGAPFLGMLLDETAGVSLWQTYFGVENLEHALRTVGNFGGKAISGPVASPFGPIAIAEDATGAGFHLCEVEVPVFDEVRESDSILDL